MFQFNMHEIQNHTLILFEIQVLFHEKSFKVTSVYYREDRMFLCLSIYHLSKMKINHIVTIEYQNFLKCIHVIVNVCINTLTTTMQICILGHTCTLLYMYKLYVHVIWHIYTDKVLRFLENRGGHLNIRHLKMRIKLHIKNCFARCTLTYAHLHFWVGNMQFTEGWLESKFDINWHQRHICLCWH